METTPLASSASGTLRRFAIRFAWVYTALQWIPLVVMLNTSTVTAGAIRGPNWWGRPTFAVGNWVIATLLALPPAPQDRLSGNSLPLLLGIVTLALVAALLAAAWTWAMRARPTTPAMADAWLHTLLRFLLAAPLLSYGWGKVLPSQFGLSLDYVALEVAQHNPRDLLWAFMTGSREYQVVTGLVELTAGILLLTRRTAPLGACLGVFAMANVVILDVCYDVPIKFLAMQLLFLSLAVFAPFAQRIVDVLVLNRATGALSSAMLMRSSRHDRLARAGGLALGAWLILGAFQENAGYVNQSNQRRQAPLVGVWDVERVTRGEVDVPLVVTDPTLWRRLIIQSTNSAIVVPMVPSSNRIRNVVRSGMQIAADRREMRLMPFPLSDPITPLTFTFELPAGDRLELRSTGPEPVTIRLRKFDSSNYTLLSWQRSWDW
jgi:uncharacterized membrane protein YphA (DoxX/SURF4 family)